MAKIKLSETIHFPSATEEVLNDSSGLDSILKISVDPTSFKPGDTVDANVQCIFANDDIQKATSLDYLAVSLEGKINVDGRPTQFVHAAEIEHGRAIRNGTHFTQPVSIRIPLHAIPCSDNFTWKLSARAVWQNTRLIQDQLKIHVSAATKV